MQLCKENINEKKMNFYANIKNLVRRATFIILQFY